jgi:predicted DNA-binding transcriptional regulator YafY
MPRNCDLNGVCRQWEILKLLPTKPPGITSRYIQEQLHGMGYNVVKRTVERDLQDLTHPFPILCNEKSRPFGWYWNPGASSHFPAITLAEALSLRLVENLLKPLLPKAILASLQAHFNQARAKLEALQKDQSVADWQRKVRHVPPALPLLPPCIDAEVLDVVQQALLHDRQIEVEYETAQADKSSRQTLHPLAMVQRGPITYLVATAFNYRDIRLYALHRMHSAVAGNQPANRPDDFDLDDYIAGGAFQFGGRDNIVLKAELWEGLAYLLQETPLSADQQIQQDDDTFTLTATVADSWQLRWWILSQGDGIEVIEPIMLRKEIANSLKTAAEQYV